MKNLEINVADRGRLLVNREYADVLHEHGLDSFEKLMNYDEGQIAKHFVKERKTSRLVFHSAHRIDHVFFLKQHEQAPLKEYYKSFFRLTKPVIGARNEWDAILRFHEAQIPTMSPVAFGKSGSRSFLLTEEIANCVKLCEWFDEFTAEDFPEDRQTILAEIAELTRRMHAANIHHQDYYLTHMLLPTDDEDRGIHIIDLGRARKRHHLAPRWIVKDLAQFLYSGMNLTPEERAFFLETYFQNHSRSDNRDLVDRIEKKIDRIARHSLKNRL